jgi:hypothetical protein
MKKIIILLALTMLSVVFVVWFLEGRVDHAPENTETFGELPFVQSTSSVQQVLFSDLVTQAPDASFAAVLDLLHLDVYDTYTCPQYGPDEQTLMVIAKYVPDSEGINSLSAAKVAVAQWESFMLVDVGHLLYPTFAIGSFTTPVAFQAVPGTSLRSAEVTINGKKITIAYSWLLNYVLISTSLDCLEATMEKIYEHHV